MKIEKLFNQIKSPCGKCPYKLGLVHTVVNTCPQCKLNNYQNYGLFKKQLLGENSFEIENGRRY